MKTGLLAEFDTPEALVSAVRGMRERGYRALDAFTPYPIHAVEDALGLPRSPLPLVVLLFGLGGAAAAYFVQWWCNAWDYPLNVGNRPLHSAPTMIPITFEMGVLAASLTGFVAFFAMCGLPELHAPIFGARTMERASVDRFVLGVDERDPAFDAVQAQRDLEALGALSVSWARREEP